MTLSNSHDQLPVREATLNMLQRCQLAALCTITCRRAYATPVSAILASVVTRTSSKKGVDFALVSAGHAASSQEQANSTVGKHVLFS